MSGERVPEIVPISSANKPTQVEIVGDRIRIASLEVVDRALAGFLEPHPRGPRRNRRARDACRADGTAECERLD